jgi:acyl dehydratase
MKSLSDLRAGDRFRHVRTCDRYRPLYYAAASGDFNPLHVDPEVARRAGLDGCILQGMCTFAWLAEACEAYLGAPGRLTRLAARFSRPVAIGDQVTFEGRCTAAAGGRVELEISARNGRGEEVLKAARA